MSNTTTELYETEGVVNVTYEQDRHGQGYYCSGKVDREEDLRSACEPEEGFIYDRGFGG